MRIAYFDCFSGVSGDMFVGALLDAGCDAKALLRGLKGLSLSGYRIEIRREKRGGFAGTRFEVIESGKKAHRHAHDHGDGHHHHHHPHRTLPEIESILKRAKIPDPVRARAFSAFRAIAEVEGRAHGIPAKKVHFHEVGAVDTIVDIVAAALALHLMKVETIAASALPLGGGLVSCDHGRVPVPAPGTIGLLRGAVVRFGAGSGEMVTPTGAALLQAWARSIGEPVEIRPESIGYGVGKRDPSEIANLLRVVVGETDPGFAGDQVYLLEANLDDMPGELVGHALGKLFEAGALDAYLVPVQMKKNRPGVILSAIVPPAKRLAVEEAYFRETTTLGVRRRLLERSKLPREESLVQTSLGRLSCKISTLPDGTKRFSPEYDELRRIGDATGRGLPELLSEFERSPKKIVRRARR